MDGILQRISSAGRAEQRKISLAETTKEDTGQHCNGLIATKRKISSPPACDASPPVFDESSPSSSVDSVRFGETPAIQCPLSDPGTASELSRLCGCDDDCTHQYKRRRVQFPYDHVVFVDATWSTAPKVLNHVNLRGELTPSAAENRAGVGHWSEYLLPLLIQMLLHSSYLWSGLKTQNNSMIRVAKCRPGL